MVSNGQHGPMIMKKVIEKDTVVEIERIEGVKLIVKKKG